MSVGDGETCTCGLAGTCLGEKFCKRQPDLFDSNVVDWKEQPQKYITSLVKKMTLERFFFYLLSINMTYTCYHGCTFSNMFIMENVALTGILPFATCL